MLWNIPLRGGRVGAGQFGKGGSQCSGAAQGPLGTFLISADQGTALSWDQSDASPPHPCTVFGLEGTGI